MAGQLTGRGCVVCVHVWPAGLIIIPSSVHVGQLLEAGTPVVEVVIVLVPCAGGVEGADRAGGRAAALIVKHQQGVIRRSCGVVVCCSQTLNRKKNRRWWSVLRCLQWRGRWSVNSIQSGIQKRKIKIEEAMVSWPESSYGLNATNSGSFPRIAN